MPTFNLVPILRRFLRKRKSSSASPRRRHQALQLEALETRAVPAGTWTPLNNLAPAPVTSTGDYLGTMILLTNGTVMVQGGDVSNVWYQLTPDSSGSYVNPTWSQLAFMSTPRLFSGSAVLPNGNVYVIGGEYSGANGANNDTNTAEIYNPVSNTWSGAAPFPQSQFGDDPVEVLNNGLVLGGDISGPQTYLYNPATNTWTSGGTKLRSEQSDEETWVKLPDGSILSYDLFSSLATGTGSAQRYIPSTNTWVDAGTVPVPLSAVSVPRGGTFYELGPAFLLPDGRVFQIGGISNTALYTPSTNTWVAGPTIPNGKGADDAPGAVLPDGNVIFAADTPYGNAPTQLYDFDPVANTITPMTLPTALNHELQTNPAFIDRMVMLPTGQLLFGDDTDQLWVYSDNTAANASLQPTISSVVPNGNATYTLTGTQLNGISEGTGYGDDVQSASNYPIIRLTNSNGNVYTAMSFNWTSLVASGSTPVTTQFTLPPGLPPGTYSLTVSANGVISAPFSFTVPFSVISSTPASGAIVSSAPTSFSVTFNEPVVASSVQASEFQVNGIPANSVVLSAGNTVATFTFTTSPVTAEGSVNMTIAGGVITGVDGSLNNPFSGSAYFDTLVLAVTSTTPANGAVITPPGSGGTLTFDVVFNRAIDPKTVTTANLSISQGTVTAATVLPGNMAVNYTISGLTLGAVTVAIPTGQVSDSADNPYFTPFSSTFTISAPTVISPYVVSIDRTTPPGPSTNATTVSWTVTFNKAVTGVTPAAFQLASTGTIAGTVSQVAAVSASVYTVTVSGVTGSGTLGLNLVDNNSIRDLSGNALVQASGPATFQNAATFASSSYPVSSVLADLTGDGFDDLIVANQIGSGTVSVMLGNGNGTFQSPKTFATGAYPFQVDVADLNGDGKPDLVVANYSSNSVSVLLGNGNGTFQTQKSYATGTAPSSVAVADVNGDGKPDLLVANYGDGTISELLGNGNGTFQTQTTFSTGYYPFALTLGDVNGDGIPDLISANKYNNNVSVLLSNGNGTFQSPLNFVVGSVPVAVTAADLNGDGKLDLVVANEASADVSVLLGNGNGTFLPQTTFGTDVGPYGVAVADLNGDGFPDIVAANYNATNPGHISVLLGNGNGTFQTQQQLTAGVAPSSVAIGDVNGDSRPDIVAANYKSGNVSVWVNAGNGNFTGQVYTITPAVPTHFVVSGTPTSVPVGSSVTFTVTDLDQFNSTNTTYSGTVHFTSSDSQAVLPADVQLIHGEGIFTATLNTTGNQTITATDTANSAINGTSPSIAVTVVGINHFAINVPAVATAGTPFSFTVTAQDLFFHTVAGYNGTIHFSSSDTSAVLPPDSTLTGGIGTFSATLNTPGSQTLLIDDTTTNTLTGMTGPIAVSAAATHFAIAAPSTTTAGNALVFAVTALDQSNLTAVGFTGTVHFSSSDGQAALPADAVLTNGVGFFAAILKTAGNQTITATNTLATSTTGTSSPISVIGLAANHFAITAPANAITGNPLAIAVKAVDPFGNTFAGYSGTVHFASTDASAALPGNATLSAGTGTFNVTLKTPGSQTVSANDAGNLSIAGTSNSIATLGLVVSSFTVTSTGFIAAFNKPFNPSTINLYDNAGVYGPDDVLLTGPSASQTSFHGSLIIDPSNQTITFIKTSTFSSSVNTFNPQSGVLAAGTYTVTFRSAANGFVDLLGAPLDGTASGNPAGSNYTTTFVVASTPAEVVGIPGFARGPNSAQTINLPNNMGFGIPLNLSTGSGVTAGKFTLQYNSALLSITGVAVNSALTGATLTYDAVSTAGSAVIDFSSPTALAAGSIRLGGLVATVPNSAAPLYTQKAMLHWSSVSINGGAIAAVGDDAVDVNAYFGDASGDGVLSGGDAALISRVATGVDNNPALGVIGGFSAFRLADPVLIGDLTGNGALGAGAVTLMNSFLSGTARAQIPALPTGLTIPANGVDPALSIPTNLQATPGSTVVVPVQIDSGRPEGSAGMTEAILALQYDPAEFTVSAQDVQLGNLLLTPLPTSGERGEGEGSGWQLQIAINSQTGEIGIDLFSSTPIQSTAGGNLVTITLHVRNTAPVGVSGLDLVTQVNPTGHLDYQTLVSDPDGALVLHTVMTPSGLALSEPCQISMTNALVSNPFAVLQTGATASAQESGSMADSNNSAVVSQSAIRNPQSAIATEVFGNLELLSMPESSFVQPGPFLNSDQANAVQTGAFESYMLLAPEPAGQLNPTPIDQSTVSSDAEQHGQRGSFIDLIDGDKSDLVHERRV